MLYLSRSFSSKQPSNEWLFGGNRPATEGSLRIFATLYPCKAFHHACVISSFYAALAPLCRARIDAMQGKYHEQNSPRERHSPFRDAGSEHPPTNHSKTCAKSVTQNPPQSDSKRVLVRS
mmetsp:Transcript_45591/g.73502  ORF Transcript_45591/g.73502 Transcript_45591/m.73502 type:complete len:120 (+) Transcript_45591:120-479(+)